MSDLAVEVREKSGKGAARKLRAAGRAPGVLYGQGRAPVSLSFEPRLLDKLLQSEGLNALFELNGPDVVRGRTVLVKEVQRHPIQGSILHADLYEIDVTQTITVHVPVHLVGTPRGVSLDGGLLDHSLRELEVDCLPGAIPEAIEIDVSDLGLGATLHVSEVVLPEGVTMRTHSDLAVVGIVAPTIEEAPAAEAAEEAAAAGAEGGAPAPGEAEPGSEA